MSMTLADHLRLAFPDRPFIARGPSLADVEFTDVAVTQAELAATHAAALALWNTEQTAKQVAAAVESVRPQIAALLMALNDAQLVSIVPVWVHARFALELGRHTAAKLIVESADIDPSLEPIRAQILAFFP